MFEITTVEDERTKEEKRMELPGIIEAQIKDAVQGFMVATVWRGLSLVIFLLKHSVIQVQWKDSGAGELNILTEEWFKLCTKQ